MIVAPYPDNEAERLKALIDLCVLDTAPEAALDAIVQCAAHATGAPIALISLIDTKRQWFKARHGLEAPETHRDFAFCTHAILDDEPLVVTDSEADPRFCDNPLVTGAPFVKAYLGVPIRAPNGAKIGTVCAIDQRPHAWSPQDVAQIRRLAELATELFRHRHAAQRSEELAEEVCALNAAMAEKERLLEQIADIAAIGGWEFDLRTQTARFDAKVGAIHGLATDRPVTLGAILGRYSPASHRALLETALAAVHRGEDWDISLPIESAADGSRRWVHIRGRPLFDDAGPIRLVGALRDVTAQREADAALQNALAIAEAATAAKGAFLANMSHEIRTPLNGVLGVAEALLRTELDPRQAEMAGLILDSGQVLRRLVTDILDMSKIEAGKLEVLCEPFDLREALETTADLMRVRADEKGLGFAVRYGATARGRFEGDAVRLRQILANLCHNAIKFTPRGRVEVRVDLEDDPGHAGLLSICVEDTGVGFDEETGRRLFQRFEQGGAGRAFGGTGLGLSICLGLAEMMGGSLSAVSAPGRGSCFTLQVPLRRTVSLQVYDAERRRLGAAGRGGAPPSLPPGLAVLLVEDHPVNRRLAQLMLEPFDVALATAADGAEALALLKRRPFDLVLMDMQMPVMDGLEATRAWRAEEAAKGLTRTPILMLSANVMAEHLAAFADAGCDGHVGKPMALQELIGAMQTAIAAVRPGPAGCDAQAC